MDAISSEHISDPIRFLNLIILLESLLSSNTKIKSKFSNLYAKLFEKNFHLNFEKTRDELNALYKKRSIFVHSGKLDICRNELENTMEYAKQALNLYLINPELFKNMQKQLC